MRSPATIWRALSLWLPVAAWAAVLFALSAQSDLPPVPPHVTDKMLHAGAYTVLGGALLRALAGGRWHGVTLGTAVVAIALTTGYGVSDEFHQSFVPKRSVEVADVAADLAGGTIAATLALGVRWWRGRRIVRAADRL